MFNKTIIFSQNVTVDLVLKIILGLVLSFAISPLVWEVSEIIDVKFGSLIVCLVPAIFGWRAGGIAVFMYVLTGILGFPVFAGHQGGIHYLIPDSAHGYSLSTGYLYGFIMASFVVGFLAEKIESSQILKVFGLYLIGHLIILSIGLYHMAQIPQNEFELVPVLKSLIPSFLIKGGIFMVIMQMIDRRINHDRRHGTKSNS